MQTLRSYNKRMGQFGSGKVKKSRRKLAIGGESSMWDPTYRDSSMETPGGTSAQMMEGLRTEYASGGRVKLNEGGDLYTEEELEEIRKAELSNAPAAALAPGLDPNSGVMVGRVTRGPTLADAVAVPSSPEEVAPSLAEGMDFNIGEKLTGNIEARANAQLEAQGRSPAYPPRGGSGGSNVVATSGVSDTEETEARGAMAAKEGAARKALLGHYGLREGARESTLPGGIKKYVDPATGKTLYSNTFDTGGTKRGSVSTYESGPVAKENADRLTAAIQARLTSGDPADLEQARQLAVTPAHRALIAEADNMRGLRARAMSGDPTALYELQLRGQTGLMRAQAQSDMMKELYKHQLGQVPTPLQLAEFNLKSREADIKAGRETRAENFAQNTAMIKNYFGEDEAGKVAATRFHQRLAATLPDLKGDISQLKPEQQNLLLGASRILDLYEADQKPGWIASLFGKQAPRYDQLLEAMRDAKIQSNWLSGGELVTPFGKLAERDVDAGTWKTITKMITDAQRSAPAPKK